jgi:hypothetical protein
LAVMDRLEVPGGTVGSHRAVRCQVFYFTEPCFITPVSKHKMLPPEVKSPLHSISICFFGPRSCLNAMSSYSHDPLTGRRLARMGRAYVRNRSLAERMGCVGRDLSRNPPISRDSAGEKTRLRRGDFRAAD